jgi:hypothetical protein
MAVFQVGDGKHPFNLFKIPLAMWSIQNVFLNLELRGCFLHFDFAAFKAIFL